MQVQMQNHNKSEKKDNMTPSKANNATIMNSNVIEVDEIPNNKLK
jgi:hypothetical protein